MIIGEEEDVGKYHIEMGICFKRKIANKPIRPFGLIWGGGWLNILKIHAPGT